MTITVKSCGDCPFGNSACPCRAAGKDSVILMYDYWATDTTHPSCPLRTEKITVELENTVTLPQHESSE